MPADIPSLHRLYANLTGFDLRLDMAREQTWYQWTRFGFTADDLRLVIVHLRSEIKRGNRNAGALKFHNLIGQPDYFEEDLALARAGQRVAQAAPPPNRAAVLRASGRPAAPPPPDPRSAAQILAGLKELKAKLRP